MRAAQPSEFKDSWMRIIVSGRVGTGHWHILARDLGNLQECRAFHGVKPINSAFHSDLTEWDCMGSSNKKTCTDYAVSERSLFHTIV
jgi:hypothetical protein